MACNCKNKTQNQTPSPVVTPIAGATSDRVLSISTKLREMVDGKNKN